MKDVLKTENAQIETIIVTHWHKDHIGGVPDVLKLTGPCKVLKLKRIDAADEDHIPITFANDGDVVTTEGATIR